MPAAAATEGRETLSSRLTGALQIGPMVLWMLDAYVIVWLLLHRFPGLRGLGGNGLVATMNRLAFLLPMALFVLLPAISWWAIGLRRVATDGSHLMVHLGSSAEARIPLAEVSDVGEWRLEELRVVKVTFAARTAVGRSLRFLAPTHVRVARDETHPVAVALREMVQAARSDGEVRPFGRRTGDA